MKDECSTHARARVSRAPRRDSACVAARARAHQPPAQPALLFPSALRDARSQAPPLTARHARARAMRAPVIFGLAVSLAIALTLQILARAPRATRGGHPRRLLTHCAQACALYDNWWPLLTGAWYVIVPAPFLFLSGGSADSYTSMGGGGDESWEDLAKFLAGARRAARRVRCCRAHGGVRRARRGVHASERVGLTRQCAAARRCAAC